MVQYWSRRESVKRPGYRSNVGEKDNGRAKNKLLRKLQDTLVPALNKSPNLVTSSC